MTDADAWHRGGSKTNTDAEKEAATENEVGVGRGRVKERRRRREIINKEYLDSLTFARNSDMNSTI